VAYTLKINKDINYYNYIGNTMVPNLFATCKIMRSNEILYTNLSKKFQLVTCLDYCGFLGFLRYPGPI